MSVRSNRLAGHVLLSNVKLLAVRGAVHIQWSSRGEGVIDGSVDSDCMRRGFASFTFYKVGTGGTRKKKENGYIRVPCT